MFFGGRFLEDCCYRYSQQIISAVPNEAQILHNLIKRAPETQKHCYCNTKCHPKPKKKINKIQLFLRQKVLFHTNINNKDTGKGVFKMQGLKNGL